MVKRPAAALRAAAWPKRRRIRGKQPPPEDWRDLGMGSAALAGPQAPAPAPEPPAAAAARARPRQRADLCRGLPDRPCRFAANGSGTAAQRQHGRDCVFCDGEALQTALQSSKGRGNVLRSLKKWRRGAPEIFDAAFGQSAVADLDDAQRQRLLADACEATYSELMERRKSIAAARAQPEEEDYLQRVEQDRAYVRKKFFPSTRRRVRHCGHEWQNPMPAELRDQVQGLAPNDAGLPKAAASRASAAVEAWCKRGSWDVCRRCAAVQPQHLKESAALEGVAAGKIITCKNCQKPEDRRAWAPRPEEAPRALRGLTAEQVRALRPLDVDCGPDWKAEFGHYFHSAMIRFSWSAEDVEDKIEALDRRGRKAAKKALAVGRVGGELGL